LAYSSVLADGFRVVPQVASRPIRSYRRTVGEPTTCVGSNLTPSPLKGYIPPGNSRVLAALSRIQGLGQTFRLQKAPSKRF
jgi:hypothetical protein